jgi:integral membrane protein (TIGR01906 family)
MPKIEQAGSWLVQIFTWGVAACAATLVLIGLFHALVFSDLFHSLEHRRLGTAQTFAQAPPMVVVQQLLAYLRSDGLQLMQHHLFSYRERRHYQEVKQMLNGSKTVGLWGGVALIGLMPGLGMMTYRWQNWPFSAFTTVCKRAAVVLVGVVIVCGLFALNFEAYFLRLHNYMFTTRNWLLPADSATIRLFPPQYFFDFLLLYATLVLSVAALLVIFAQVHTKEGIN